MEDCATIMAKHHGEKGGFIIQMILKIKKVFNLNKKISMLTVYLRGKVEKY